MDPSTATWLKWATLAAGVLLVVGIAALRVGGREALIRWFAILMTALGPPFVGALAASALVPGYDEEGWLALWLVGTTLGYAAAAAVWRRVKKSTTTA